MAFLHSAFARAVLIDISRDLINLQYDHICKIAFAYRSQRPDLFLRIIAEEIPATAKTAICPHAPKNNFIFAASAEKKDETSTESASFIHINCLKRATS